MTRINRNLSLTAFILGLLAVSWVAIGYIGGSALALAVSCIIAAAYVAGGLEMRRFHENTGALAEALGTIPDDLGHLDDWLQRVPAALRNAVRLRIDGQRVALPGPGVTPYLVGLLVLLGMLGTFLGMVFTLNGAVLALEGTTDLHTIRSALAAPVKGLGVAFGTSVAGVATSAMLGLISTLCRRDRHQVSQTLDHKIAGTLRGFSLIHQRQETFKALQAQSQALPGLVGKLDAMMSQMAEQNRQLGEQLLAGQQRFHEETKALYGDLARSVDHSLKTSLQDSATVAAEGIRPIVTATMAGIADETRGLHERLTDTVETQLASVSDRFAQTVGAVSDTWTHALARHEKATDEQHRTLQTALAAYADTFGERSQALLASADASHADFARTLQAQQAVLSDQVATQLDGIAQRFDGAVQSVAHTWTAALARHEHASDRLTQVLGQTQTSLAETFAERSAALLADVRAGQLAWHTEWAAGEQARQETFADALAAIGGKLEAQWKQAGQAAVAQQERITQTLGDTARDLVATHQRQAETTISEVTRLMQTAAEAPKAAAEVIGQLRQELTASMARDNGLLEERSRIMETLGALLDTINHASTEQRNAIDALLASSTDLLERVGSQFAAKVESEAGKLVDIGAGIAGGAIEVASLSEAFGHAVQLFSDSNEKMMTALQRVEAGLARSLTRSDEQLAYYVAQAREIVDLSIMSQRKMLDDLQRVAQRSDAAVEA